MNNVAIFALLSIISHTVFASPDLPFVGERGFNFAGGSGTAESITIQPNGFTIIQLHGTTSSSVLYSGMYNIHMPVYEGDIYYTVVGNNGIAQLDDLKNITRCDTAEGIGICVQELY